MAFTVETGTGSASANSYVTVAEADAFFSDRGTTTWTGADAVKQAALIAAADYLNSAKRFPYRGLRFSATQRLLWPRTGVVERNGLALTDGVIPTALKDAQCHLALIALTGGALWSVLQRGGQVTSESVGPISVSYAQGAPIGVWYESAMELLDNLLRSGPADDALPYDVAPTDVGTVYEAGYFTNYGAGGG